MKIEKGFKIVREHEGRYLSAFVTLLGERTYELGKWTRRGNPEKFGPLSVFASKEKAEAFYIEYRWQHFKLMSCDYVASKKQIPFSVWYCLSTGDRIGGQARLGTVLADAVRITRPKRIGEDRY